VVFCLSTPGFASSSESFPIRLAFPAMVFWLALGAAHAQGQLMHFVGEEIDIQVLGDSCIVSGTYHFRNATGEQIAQELLYPFPGTGDLALPARIEATNLTTGERVTVARVVRGYVFSVILPPRGEIAYRVRYVQTTPSERMIYMLTSTRHWNRPLERAAYSIMVPEQYSLTSLSIPADTTFTSLTGTTYRSRKVNFMPVQDLVLHWKKRNLP
jgi:hypothetical protein